MKKLNCKNVLLVGNGISGKGADFALSHCGIKHRFLDCDEILEDNSECFDLIVVSPGIKRDHRVFVFSEQFGIELIGEIELGFRLNTGKIVAVTGTNGKTTTVEMIHKILSEQYKSVMCGNIGVSFSEVAARGGYDIAVVEVSSFQLETVVDFAPDIAVITNISDDHLDRHKTMEVYAGLKKRIAARQQAGQYIVLSQDSIPLRYLMDFNPESNVMFSCVRGKISGVYLDSGNIFFYGEKVISTQDLPFVETHNTENFLFAVAVAKICGIENKNIIKAISDFTPDKHRIELIRSINGVNFYDDSKGTNVAATLCALNSMSGSVCLIAGGSEKNAFYDKLFTTRAELKKINLIGESAQRIMNSAFINGFSSVEIFSTLQSAVENAYKSGCRNVLLSPASASFDMFKDYIDRSEKFIEIVQSLV